MPNATYTASQIAAAIGRAPSTVRERLAGIPAADKLQVSGNWTAAWAVDQFPLSLREDVALAARKGNCTIEGLLSTPRRQWQPQISLGNIAPEKITEAERLREALKPFLTAPRDPGLSAEEWKRRGVDFYFRVFKDRPRITTHHWDRLIRRTELRDNGCQNWDAIQIYLSDRLKRNPVPATRSAFAMR
jgi:hypothetical protein